VNPLPRLYAIADASFADPVEVARALFNGGVRLLQVRNKTSNSRELLDQVERVLRLAPAGAVVIVNDRPDVARLAAAAGVHLGQTDMPAAAARQVLEPGQLLGLSTHNLNQALEADNLPVDYIAVGPVFPTSTKLNPDPVLGVDGLAEICGAVHKPVVAIGGIRLENVGEVLQAGAQSIAVIRDLLSSTDIKARALEWMREVDRSAQL
jgi:thiamine-phosphate pyrophosphorylase